MTLERPLLGFNVIQELIRGQHSGAQVLLTIASLLGAALEIQGEQANAIVSFIQTQNTDDDHAEVKVGFQDVVIRQGQVAHVKCEVPVSFNLSNQVVLFEPNEVSAQLEQLDVGESPSMPRSETETKKV